MNKQLNYFEKIVQTSDMTWCASFLSVWVEKKIFVRLSFLTSRNFDCQYTLSNEYYIRRKIQPNFEHKKFLG